MPQAQEQDDDKIEFEQAFDLTGEEKSTVTLPQEWFAVVHNFEESDDSLRVFINGEELPNTIAPGRVEGSFKVPKPENESGATMVVQPANGGHTVGKIDVTVFKR